MNKDNFKYVLALVWYDGPLIYVAEDAEAKKNYVGFWADVEYFDNPRKVKTDIHIVAEASRETILAYARDEITSHELLRASPFIFKDIDTYTREGGEHKYVGKTIEQVTYGDWLNEFIGNVKLESLAPEDKEMAELQEKLFA